MQRGLQVLIRFLRLVFTHLFEFSAGDILVGVGKTDLAPDILGSEGIIPGDHDHPDPGGITFAYRVCYLRADRVGKPDKSKEGKREIMLTIRQFGPGERCFCHTEDSKPLRCHGV